MLILVIVLGGVLVGTRYGTEGFAFGATLLGIMVALASVAWISAYDWPWPFSIAFVAIAALLGLAFGGLVSSFIADSRR